MAIVSVMIVAAVVINTTIQTASTALFAFAELAARVTAVSSVMLRAKGARELTFCLLANTVKLGTLKQAIGLSLRETFYGLGGELLPLFTYSARSTQWY